ncbi:MAG: glycosyltransferase family 2 protein [Patescibacteria group bacterium]
MNYLKIAKATELSGRDRTKYRLLEMLPGFLSVGTLLILIVFSFVKPVWVAYFLIAFNVYYVLLVVFLAIYLITSYLKFRENKKIDWLKKCEEMGLKKDSLPESCLYLKGTNWKDLIHLIILPTYNEDLGIIKTCFQGLVDNKYPLDKMIVVLAIEERAGEAAIERAKSIEKEFAHYFRNFLISSHPDNIEGELKGKGANQSFAGKLVKKEIIDKEGLDYEKIMVSVFDIDTVALPGYFYCLSYHFLTTVNPHRASYQPVPVYHNNIWSTPFFARVSAGSNTFWQMMQQIRPEKLATYSSHSMPFKALADIGFWSTNMVSEDSRIFWHCFLHYNGDYRVEPLYFPVSMDATCDCNAIETAKSLYKQQRRWAWGSENIPYLLFNVSKRWSKMDKKKTLRHIWIQVYGFHSWATTALIIGVIGWFPIIFGGSSFNESVIFLNLPNITQKLMTMGMVGLVISSLMASILLPKRPKNFSFFDNCKLIVEWIFIPVSVIVFGAIPCLDAQIRLMMGKYMGFWVTPKNR